MKGLFRLKHLAKTAIFIMLSLLMFSCSENEGAWKDNIQLSQKEAVFSANSDSLTIMANGTDDWWISDVSLDDDFIDIDSINTILDSFDILHGDFIIHKYNQKELKIIMNTNLTDKQRILIIGLQSGNYFDQIKITQSKG